MQRKNSEKSTLPISLLERAVPLLLAWYGEAKRPLPWRMEPTAYHVWVSEIMLQQTRIEAVIPYYERFLKRLPDIKALADVPEGELLKLWEGLGYYSRARNLKKAAMQIMSDFGGSLPESAAELRTLAGIGPYTAGAIASIAFGKPCAAVDGNVLRVVTRLCACRDDIMQSATRERVTAALEQVYPVGRDAGNLTQALMELGESVCIPNGEPRCLDCPLAEHCLALRQNLRDELPVRTPKKPRRIENRTVLLLRHGETYALRKRGKAGLLAELWEFPSTEGTLDETSALEAARALGATPVKISSAGEATHIFTHVEWHMTGYFVECSALPDSLAHATPTEIRRDFAVPKAFRAYLAQI